MSVGYPPDESYADHCDEGTVPALSTSAKRPTSGLRRDIDLLRQLTSEESMRRGGLGVVRIAQRLGREKGQISRAMRALAEEGLVERDPVSRTYQLGWGLYALAARGVEARLVRTATLHLHRLAEQYRVRAELCVLVGGRVLKLLTVPPGTTGRMEAPPDAASPDADAAPISATPAGPALVIEWPESSLRTLTADRATYDAVTEHIHHAVRHHYVAFTDAGRHLRYAAPIRDFRGIILGAIELGYDERRAARDGEPGGPEHGASAAADEDPPPQTASGDTELTASLVGTAAQLSAELGYDERAHW